MSNTASLPVIEDHEVSRGMVTLFIVQIFGTLSYSIIMSSLTLFCSESLHLSTSESLALTGSFLAFNFGLHFLGGYMGGRYISNRMLFCIGMLFQAIGCVILYKATYASLMVGLAVFLTGSGLNVTCMNSMVTQLFTDPEDHRREKAFLWNYSGMNIGFLVGYIVAGFFGKYDLYGTVFALGGIANIITILLIAFNWQTVRDRETYLTELIGKKAKFYFQHAKATGIIITTLLVMLVLMKHAQLSNDILVCIAIIMVIFAFFIGGTRKTHKEKGRMMAFCFFLIANVIFWTVYQLSPEILMLFMVHNVDMIIYGVKIQPQWMSNINTIIIIFGGPFLAWYFNYLRVKKGKKVSLPFLFAFAVICMGIAILLQSVGIWFDADKTGIIGIIWIILFYVFQSVGELCISPIGYAAIGRLVPRKLQNLMMGLWCMMTGVAAIFASQIGDWAVAGKSLAEPIVTDPGFAKTFGILGIFTIIMGIVMFMFYPKLYRMINETTDVAIDPKDKKIV
jgi:proton-dependent oligopeptide transporter, POT family